jgi:hypothetical protein
MSSRTSRSVRLDGWSMEVREGFSVRSIAALRTLARAQVANALAQLVKATVLAVGYLDDADVASEPDSAPGRTGRATKGPARRPKGHESVEAAAALAEQLAQPRGTQLSHWHDLPSGGGAWIAREERAVGGVQV